MDRTQSPGVHQSQKHIQLIKCQIFRVFSLMLLKWTLTQHFFVHVLICQMISALTNANQTMTHVSLLCVSFDLCSWAHSGRSLLHVLLRPWHITRKQNEKWRAVESKGLCVCVHFCHTPMVVQLNVISLFISQKLLKNGPQQNHKKNLQWPSWGTVVASEF